MKDATYTDQSDTTIPLTDNTNIQQIVLHNKYENTLKSDDSNLTDIISLIVSVAIFALGYLFNSVVGNLKDKKALRRKYKGWKNDLKSMYRFILMQSDNIKEQYEFLEREKWGFGNLKKMPPLLTYHLINFDKYDFTEALVKVEKLSETDSSEVTVGLLISIEKVKHYENAFEDTVSILTSKSVIIHEEFERKLMALNDEVEKVLSSEDAQDELKIEITTLYQQVVQKYASTKPENAYNPFVFQREYFEPLEGILHKYKLNNPLYQIFSVLLELTTIVTRLKNERLSAIENLKLQFHEYVAVAQTIKRINEKLK